MVESNLSHFAASALQIPTIGNFVNDMGGPLDHGSDEAKEPQEGHTNDGTEAGQSGTQWHAIDIERGPVPTPHGS